MQEIKDRFKVLFTDTLSIIGMKEVQQLNSQDTELGLYTGMSKTFRNKEGNSCAIGVTGGFCSAVLLKDALGIHIANKDTSIKTVLTNMQELQTKVLGEL